MTIQQSSQVKTPELKSPAAPEVAGHQTFVSEGMPPLAFKEKAVSFFEFWPTWAMYLPVALQWLVLSGYFRSLTLPLLANPKLKLSGMVGVPKSELLCQATGSCSEAILPWFVVNVDAKPLSELVTQVMAKMQSENFKFPVVAKPDIGCRGSGVRLVHSAEQLRDYLSAYPHGSSVMIQQLASFEPEAGVFYVREPGSATGQIISLALKYMPYVVGNGRDTLAQLIAKDPRAGSLQHLYRQRHSEHLEEVIAEGRPYRLVFSASHCRGAIFKDAQDLITPELSASLDNILNGLPEFHYGRLDIKFRDTESLQSGQHLEIIEINTASSEPLHIWDSEASFVEAINALLYQYRLLFRFGHKNRARGFRPPGITMLIRHWKKELALKKFYPATD